MLAFSSYSPLIVSTLENLEQESGVQSFFISGGLSIGSGRNSSSCLVIGTMVMSILSAISAGILIMFSGLALGITECYYRSACSELDIDILHGLELVAGIVEMVIPITSSVSPAARPPAVGT